MRAKKISMMAMAAAMMISLCAVPAGASGYSTTIGGTKTTAFDKYLVMDKTANVPVATFNYEITAGNAMDYDTAEGKFQVFAGVDADKVTMAGVGTQTAKAIAFAPADQAGSTANDLVKNYTPDTEKFASKQATLDFSACAFTEPGVYRYIITETGTNQGVTNDADATRVVDVYVVDSSTADPQTGETTNTLSVDGFVLHSNDNDEPVVPLVNNGSGGSYEATKSQGFTNEYDTVNVKIEVDVEGNQASRDKYFKYTVEIEDATPGTVYTVDLSDADPTTGSNPGTDPSYVGQTNPATITVGPDGKATAVFYLQDDQSVDIQGLAPGTKYEITPDTEDYASEHTGEPTGTIAPAGEDIVVSYTNKRAGVIPTGVAMAVAPFALLTALGGAGAVSVMAKRKKKEEE